jgi:hypothetical protein
MIALTDSEKLANISCLYNAMEAVINSLYHDLGELGRDAGQSYGLAMALEHLNDQVGALVGAV